MDKGRDKRPFPVVVSQLADSLDQNQAHDAPACKTKGEVTADDNGQTRQKRRLYIRDLVADDNDAREEGMVLLKQDDDGIHDADHA